MDFRVLRCLFQTENSGRYTSLPTNDDQSRDSSIDSALEKGSSSAKSSEPHSPQSVSFPASQWRPDPRTISDATLGLSDGLTVPFALTAGLASLGDAKLVVLAGLAELMAGAISMGVGGYMGASGEVQSAATIRDETTALVLESPDEAKSVVIATLEPYISEHLLQAVAEDVTRSNDNTIAFLLAHQHHILDSGPSQRLYLSGLTIALGYLFGGFIPLLSYIFLADGSVALIWSVAVMIVTLFGFGFLKTSFLGERDWRVRVWEGAKMVALGGTAAGVSVVCVRLVG